MISMNYENVCGYLCFCCADAVDCGGGGDELRGWLWIGVRRPVDSRLRGNDGPGLVVLSCCCPALWILP